MTSQPALIKGRVRQSSGQPIAGARVLFASAPGVVPDIAALTDDTGYFSLSAPWAGDYTLEVVADGFHSQRVSTSVGTRETRELNVEMQSVP